MPGSSGSSREARAPVPAELAGRPLVFRNATVLTMDDSHRVIGGGDVLITGEQISAVGPNLDVPEGTAEIDAAGGIVMPGMIDTHRHMWQTALRGYGADWTLTQYFVWNYLQWGKCFRPQDIYAGNLLSAIEAIDAGVTTSVDWSHNLQTIDHAEAAVDALEEVPGPVRARVRQHPAGTVGLVGRSGIRRLRGQAVPRRKRHARIPDGVRRSPGEP
jgi:cytosine/adenosine deaminase-related metal-dependent hydrolase